MKCFWKSTRIKRVQVPSFHLCKKYFFLILEEKTILNEKIILFCWIIINSRKQWNVHYFLTKYELILCTE